MKSWGKTIGLLFIGVALIGNVTRAQFGSISPGPSLGQSATPDSIVQITAEAQGLPQVDPSALPPFGTFWWTMPGGGGAAPMPCPPANPTFPIYQITEGQFLVDQTAGQVLTGSRAAAQQTRSEQVATALEAQATTLVNLISQVLTTAANQSLRTLARAMNLDVPTPGDGSGGGDGWGPFTNNFSNFSFNREKLWLEITNVPTDWAAGNLHNATNQVYAIRSKTDLAEANWTIEAEFWPTNPVVMPFAVPTLGRPILFLRAEDWTDVDSDGDGIPDWWIWKYFHTLALNATNLDIEGNSLLYDYTNGFDPNVISFTLSVANFYGNQTIVPVQVNLQSGCPAYYAVLVNDTNYADAVWRPYTGTNLLATLGSADGVYDVWVGLKGWPTNATETWETDDLTLRLDRGAPVVNLTSAVNTSVCKPYLQVQGFADKPLASLSYDINNAFGFAANQDAFVTDQTFDTNQFDFTTNFFRAYDVALATNTNWITLRVTDRAGNMTTTNFYVTLDYKSATNLPTINLIWPQDGMAVSGTNVTIRGTMSDETGIIQAQSVDEEGNTNIITGIVERNGMFWIENVPVNGETEITLQATDAAGNVTAIDFTVEPSDLILTITGTPTGNDLWHGAGIVYGTVGDPNATVTVNGTNAVIDNSSANGDGTYNWTATSVPIWGQGTATFDATAYSGQNWVSSNLRSRAMSVSTPTMAPANTSLAVEMQPYVVMISYNGTEVQKFTALDYGYAWYQQTAKSQTATPVAGTNGQCVLNDRRTNSMYWYVQEASSSGSGHEKFMWGESPPDDGQEHTDNSWGGSYDGPAQWPYWDGVSLELLRAMPHKDQSWGCASCGPGYMWNAVRHYFADGVQYHWDLGGNTTFDMNVSAKTQMKLFTGGKAQVRRKNLFVIDASASEILRPPMDYGPGYPWWDVPENAIDNASLTVAGKSVGADGKLWLELPDNSDADLTVIASGKKHYDANSTAQKYKPYITANDVRLDPSAINVTNCVGQKIVFKLQFDPPVDYVTNHNNWILPGKYVNAQEWFQPDAGSISSTANGEYYLTMCHPEISVPYRYAYSIDAPYCTYYKQSSWPLTQPETGSWWISGGPKAVTCFPKLTFNNGQTVSISGVRGKLYVYRPSASMVPFSAAEAYRQFFIYPYGLIGINPACKVKYGTDDDSALGQMHYRVKVTSDFDGSAGITQICDLDYSNPAAQCTDNLDGSTEFYNGTQSIFRSMNQYTNGNTLELFDTPHNIWVTPNQMKGTFRDYVRFCPNGAESICVTLGIVTWDMNAVAERVPLTGTWGLTTDDHPAPVGPDTSDDFPAWTGVHPAD